MKIVSSLGVLSLGALALACHPAAQATDGEEPTKAEETAFADVRWVPLEKPSDRSVLEASARVRASAEAQGEVSLPVRIWVKGVRAKIGDQVKKGAPLLDVVAPEVLEAAGIFQSASERVQVHERRRDELRSLQKEGLVTGSAVFEQEALASQLIAERTRGLAIMASAGVSGAQAAAILRQGFVTLTSPVDGVVSEISVHLGETREPGGTPLLRVQGLGHARIEVRTNAAWPTGESVVFESVDGTKVPLKEVPVANLLSSEDGSHLAWFEPKEDVKLADQMVGVVRIVAPKTAFEVPSRAVEQRTGKSRLRVKRGAEVRIVEVEILSSSGARALVSGNLEEGDLVASEYGGSAAK